MGALEKFLAEYDAWEVKYRESGAEMLASRMGDKDGPERRRMMVAREELRQEEAVPYSLTPRGVAYCAGIDYADENVEADQ